MTGPDPVMNDLVLGDTLLPTVPAFLCPFLATLEDAETYSANPSFKNYCHKASPLVPVLIDHQVNVCCTEEYRNCVVYKAMQGRSFPPEWINNETVDPFEEEAEYPRWVVYGGIALMVLLGAIFIYLYWFSGLFPRTDPNAAALAIDPGVTITQQATITVASTITRFPTARSTTTLSTTIRATGTTTPTMLPTGTVTPVEPSLTPGPALETPFGTQPLFIVHRVKEGESLSTIAAQFNTNYAVIQAVNSLSPDAVIQDGKVLVVMPGQKSVTGAITVKPVYIDSAVRVDEFAVTYGVDAAEVRLLNGLGLGDWIQSNRWVVVRGK
jgi:LysM repeat protein